MNEHLNKTRGVYFDLTLIFNKLNADFFNNEITADLCWGKKTPKNEKKRSIRLGSYHPKCGLITIHRCLDQAMVPSICIERIVFHEMAHQKFPCIKGKGGKRIIHHLAFTQFEKTYPFLKEADQWFKANLHHLLRF